MVFVVFGRSRGRRLAAVAELAASQLPVRSSSGFDAGWLVVSDDRRRSEDWAPIDPGGRSEVWDPDALWAWLWHRFGDGRPWLRRGARELAARRWLRDRAHAFSSLARIQRGPELAWHLASVDDALGQQRLPQLGDSELDTVVRELRASHPAGFVRPAEATIDLIARLARPSEALQRWLRRHPVVVIDDVLQPTPTRSAALLGLIQAASHAGSTVIVTLASGRDRGGREAGVLLGWDTGDEALREESRVVAAQAPLRQALFGLVESGEVEVFCQTAEGLLPVEPWTEPGPAAPRDLADAYADGRPLPIVSAVQARRWLGHGRDRDDAGVTLLRCSDPEEEANEAARSCQQALLDGLDPGDVVLAVAGLGRQEALVSEALASHGVPFVLERPLSRMPLAQVVLRLLAVARPDPEALELAALADALSLPTPVDPRRLRRWLSRAGVGRGAVGSWSAGLVRWLVRNRIRTGGDAEDPEGPLQRTLAAVEALHREARRLAEPLEPHPWRRTLEAVLDGLGAFSGRHSTDLRIQAAVLAAIEAFTVDLATIDAGPWPREELLEQLRAVFERTPVPSAGDATARVRVVDAMAAIGLPARLLWVMGLSRGYFPDRPPVAFLVQPTWRRRLARDPVTRARHGLAGWLRDALTGPEPGGIGRLVLSWPLTRGGRAVPPAAVLADLLDLPTSDGGRFELRAATTPPRAMRRRADGPASVVDVLDRAAAEARSAGESHEPGWRELLPARVRDDFDVAVAVNRDRKGVWGAHDGVLSVPPPTPGTLSVTALESYLRCPQRYWYDRVLRLSPPDQWAPELEPRRRGTALHSILEQFFRRRELRSVVGGDPAALGRELYEVAREVLDDVERQGGFDPAYQAYARERWLAGLVDDAPAGVLRAWLDLEIAAPDQRVPVAVEAPFDDLEVGPIRLRGVLDRLDRLPDGSLVVTDYKTGQPPTRASVAEGRSLQPYAYAEAAVRRFPDAPVAATFLSLARPDRLARTGWVGDPSVLREACAPGERRYALSVDARERRQVLREAGNQAKGLLAGHFVPTRLGPARAGCASCPHARTCRVDHVRQAEQVEAEVASAARRGEGA